MTLLLAQLYPLAEVIGVDIAPVPTDRHGGEFPGNVSFVQGDVRQLISSQEDSRFQPASFDFVFERLLILGITNWKGHVEAISSLVKKGGWLECHEFSWMLYSDSGERMFDSMPFYGKVKADAEAIGLNVEIGEMLRETFRESKQFGEVGEKIYECAPKARDGAPELRGLEEQILGLLGLLIGKMSGGRRSEEEVKELERQLEEVWAGLGGRERFRIHVVFGRKA